MKQKIYNLLMVTHRGLLERCYQQVFFQHSDLSAIKTFDDYLSDFYLYLYEAKPKYVRDDIKGFYLSQIRDKEATPAWLRQTFRHFLLEENKILSEMREALADYRRQLVTAPPKEKLDITLMHVGFAIAWFNQQESAEDRYLFFRSAYKHFMGFYSWPNKELDDIDVSTILGISPRALRTRTSRLCAKVKRLVGELNDALISALNKHSLDIASEIYAKPDPNMESILKNLLEQAERDLEQYEQILALRKDKQLSLRIFKKKDSSRISRSISFSRAPLFNNLLDDFASKSAYKPKDVSFSSVPPLLDEVASEEHEQTPSKRIIGLFKTLIGM